MPTRTGMSIPYFRLTWTGLWEDTYNFVNANGFTDIVRIRQTNGILERTNLSKSKKIIIETKIMR